MKFDRRELIKKSFISTFLLASCFKQSNNRYGGQSLVFGFKENGVGNLGFFDLKINRFEKADISPLKSENTVLAGLRPDSQRYFDYHHTSIDTFDKVNKRELVLGSASMASIIYLMDKYLYNNSPVKP